MRFRARQTRIVFSPHQTLTFIAVPYRMIYQLPFR